MNTTATQTIKIEDMKLGRRYVSCREGYEYNWTVISVRHFLDFAGRECVEVKYGNRNGVCEEIGTGVAILCNVEGDINGV